MNRRTLRHHAFVGLVGALLSGCFVPDDARPQVGMAANVASKYVHRGMTMVDKFVVQPQLVVALPTVTGDAIRVTAKGNANLYNDTGDAWFPDGHAGRFSQIDFIADYQRNLGTFSFLEDLTVKGGVFNYNLPNGQEFPNGERGTTSEVFVDVSATVLEATPYFSWHYDFDEVRAPYYRGGITESFDFGKGFSLVLDGSLGYATSAQSAWMYGLDTSGWADLRGSATLNYQYDARTTLSASANGSRMMDRTLNDWFELLGIDADPIWFTFGVAFAF
ncbi:MAG: hypothetical protein H6835_17920 [Planctomycetes bacterium]|nr:hypothetical protein [Planctomycetota bacterium]